MFARFLEMTIRPEKKAEFVKKVKEEIFPILKTYKGFFDLVPLEVETEFTKFYVVSLWTRERTWRSTRKSTSPRSSRSSLHPSS